MNRTRSDRTVPAILNFIPALCIGLLLSTSPNVVLAQLSSVDDPVFGPESLTYDASTELLWLDVDLTDGLSYNDVVAQLSVGGTYEGFRHATVTEVTDLFFAAGVPDVPGVSAGNFAPIQALHALVGTSAPDIASGITATPHIEGGRVTMNASVDTVSETGEIDTSGVSDDVAYNHWLVRPSNIIDADDPKYGLESLTIDTQSGLAWLDFEHSIGQSYLQVVDKIEHEGFFEGFRHATETEVLDLLESVRVPEIPLPGQQSNAIENEGPIRALLTHMGFTYEPDLEAAGFTATESSPGNKAEVTIAYAEDGYVGSGEAPSNNAFAERGSWLLRPIFLRAADHPFHGSRTLTLDDEDDESITWIGWLDLHTSFEFSYNEVAAQLVEGGLFEGFRYATEEEVLQFLDRAGVPESEPPVSTADNEGPIRALVSLLDGASGLTSTEPSPDNRSVVSLSFGAGVGTISTSTQHVDFVDSDVGSWLVQTSLPILVDTDGDGLPDLTDPCPAEPRPLGDPLNYCNPAGSGAAKIFVGIDDQSVVSADEDFEIFVPVNALAANATLSVTEFIDMPPEVDLRLAFGPGQADSVKFFELKPEGISFIEPVSIGLNAVVTALTPAQRDALDFYLFDEGTSTYVPQFADCFVEMSPVPPNDYWAFCSLDLSYFPDNQQVVLDDIDGDGLPDISDPCPADPLNACDPNGSGAEMIVATEGGSVETPNGDAQIDVDPNDLASDATLSITQDITAEPEVDVSLAGGPSAGDSLAFYELEPDGLVFNSPVTLYLQADVNPLTPAQRDALDIYLFDEVTSAYVPQMANCFIDVTIGPPDDYLGICTLELAHFSRYALVVPLDSDGDGVFDNFEGYPQDQCPAEDASGFDVDDNGCIDSFSGLIELVGNLVSEGVIDSNMQNSLVSKVSNAEKSYDKDKICPAISKLEALQNQVAAQTGKKISVEAAALVSDYADSIIAQLVAELPAGDSC